VSEEPLFTEREGVFYQFISWLHLQKGFVLVDRTTGDIPTLNDTISAIKEFISWSEDQ